jgi:hypothetical protein
MKIIGFPIFSNFKQISFSVTKLFFYSKNILRIGFKVLILDNSFEQNETLFKLRLSYLNSILWFINNR